MKSLSYKLPIFSAKLPNNFMYDRKSHKLVQLVLWYKFVFICFFIIQMARKVLISMLVQLSVLLEPKVLNNK